MELAGYCTPAYYPSALVRIGQTGYHLVSTMSFMSTQPSTSLSNARQATAVGVRVRHRRHLFAHRLGNRVAQVPRHSAPAAREGRKATEEVQCLPALVRCVDQTLDLQAGDTFGFCRASYSGNWTALYNVSNTIPPIVDSSAKGRTVQCDLPPVAPSIFSGTLCLALTFLLTLSNLHSGSLEPKSLFKAQLILKWHHRRSE